MVELASLNAFFCEIFSLGGKIFQICIPVGFRMFSISLNSQNLVYYIHIITNWRSLFSYLSSEVYLMLNFKEGWIGRYGN